MISHHVFLRGGIGNQFFQWVYALNLQKNGFHVKLNSSFLKIRKDNQTSGKIELNNLLLSLELPVVSWNYISSLEFAFRRLALLAGVLEDDRHVYHNQGSRFFHYGYYQVNRFLDDSVVQSAKGLLRSELRVCDIAGSFCVLHVRAGDYLTNSHNFTHMGLLSVDYHVAAGQYLLKHYPNNKLIIVSDDNILSGVVLNKLAEGGLERVRLLSDVLGRNETQLDAIKTMLSAEAISLSNSSFSAMCAVLGKATNVLYPRPWFKSQKLFHVSPVLDKWTMRPAIFSE